MAVGRRCDMGCGSWPHAAIYFSCPICEQPTRLCTDLHDVPSMEEANTVLLHAQFEKFYERRCAKLGIPSEGDLPPEYERSLSPA